MGAPGVVLTAAHCVDKFRQSPGELKVRCGEWDTQHETEPKPHQDRQVEVLEIHPEFEARNLRNDFAVLFTTEKFGADGEYQVVLKEIDLPVVNHDDCQDSLRKT